MVSTPISKSARVIENEIEQAWFIHPVYSRTPQPRALLRETEAAWEEKPSPSDFYDTALAEPENFSLLSDDLDTETIEGLPEQERREYIGHVLGQMVNQARMLEKDTGQRFVRTPEYDQLHAMIPLNPMGSWYAPEPAPDGK